MITATCGDVKWRPPADWWRTATYGAPVATFRGAGNIRVMFTAAAAEREWWGASEHTIMPIGKRMKVGDYEVASEIHSGVLGGLWLGRTADGDSEQRLLIRRVALEDASAAARDALIAAAAIGKGVRHEGFIPFLGVSSSADEIAFASEFQEGESLRSVLRLAGIKRKDHPNGAVLTNRVRYCGRGKCAARPSDRG